MSFRIFAGNLAFQVTDEDLKQAFSSFGTVRFARVILDRDTGKSRGFGFVEMDEEPGKRALEALDGTDLKGRDLRLREAEPRAPGGGRPGGGGPRREGPPPRRDNAPSGGPAGFGQDAPRRRERKKPNPSEEQRRRQSGPGGAGGGRPVQKERGGARNRFRVDDEDDDDINLFDKYHEEEDYDLGSIEGVEFGEDDDSGGINIFDIETREKSEKKKPEDKKRK